MSPALKYLIPHQQLELSPEDARRLGIAPGDEVLVSQPDDPPAAHTDEAGRRVGGNGEGTQLAATAAVRSNVPPGSAFLAEGIAVASANTLTEPLIKVRKA